eukprot:scpid103451/ scgid3184/ 
MLDVLEPGSVIHVHAIVLWCATAVGKHMTDDHYLMRSKKLHRDEDIVMDRLRSMLTLAYYTVLKKFVEQDPMDSGMLSMTDFVSVLKCICPLLTEAEAASLGYKHQNRSDRYPHLVIAVTFLSLSSCLCCSTLFHLRHVYVVLVH